MKQIKNDLFNSLTFSFTSIYYQIEFKFTLKIETQTFLCFRFTT